jgi:hypothetical protein
LAVGLSYRLTQHLLWQGYRTENLDFIHRARSIRHVLDVIELSLRIMMDAGYSVLKLANRLTTWGFHVKIHPS